MRIQNKNRIHIHISEEIPKLILGNSVRLSQILMNLIGNACKFTENGDIEIKAETVASTNSNTTIKFYVKDTGIGIPKNKLDSIFDEFSQADTIDYKYQGTGLGLPIVKKLLDYLILKSK
jgi:signal transduction histidine kinase